MILKIVTQLVKKEVILDRSNLKRNLVGHNKKKEVAYKKTFIAYIKPKWKELDNIFSKNFSK